jgi:hypothetical protein
LREMSDARRGSPFVLLRQTARLLETARLENKENDYWSHN